MLYHRELVERMQEKYPPGTRVEVVSLCNEEEHLKPGMKGTVVAVDDQPALLVDWDNGSSLSLLNRERPLPGGAPAGGIPGHDDELTLLSNQLTKVVMTYPIHYSMGRRQTGSVSPPSCKRFPTWLPAT